MPKEFSEAQPYILNLHWHKNSTPSLWGGSSADTGQELVKRATVRPRMGMAFLKCSSKSLVSSPSSMLLL